MHTGTCDGDWDMHFPLKVDKTIQAIGVLFRADDVQRMPYMRLLKLLYIADRETLREIGRPITGGPIVAMERGPVLDEVYNLIRGQHREMPLWDEYFRKQHYTLELRREPDVGRLSRYEIEKLQEIAKQHEDDDEWALSRFTHSFEEWRKNDPGTSCRAIPLSDVLAAVGRKQATAQIAQEAHDAGFFDRLFGR
jgi:uncharacterized phage-associated protein